MNSKTKILYVDDESINLVLFEINFSKKYAVFTADSGAKGIELLAINPDITVIVSDMKMPSMNGIEFIKKAKEKYPDKEFFILTGFDITEEILDAINTGLILKYFKKPFNMKEMDMAITDAILPK